MMNAAKTHSNQSCAYCGNASNPLTREHLWPISLSRRFNEDATNPHFFLERSPQKFLIGEPTVKDVCCVCNNGELSQLDVYACELYDRFWCKKIERGQVIKFDYDYDRLIRWLLKISFNSARIHDSDPGILNYYSKYMIGRFRAPRNMRLFLQLISPAIVNAEGEALTKGEVKAGTKFYPDRLREGHTALSNYELKSAVGRSVIINAFAFSIFVYDRNAPETNMRRLEVAFAEASPSATLVKDDGQTVYVAANGLDANEALYWHYAIHKDAYGEPFRAFEEKHLNRNPPRI